MNLYLTTITIIVLVYLFTITIIIIIIIRELFINHIIITNKGHRVSNKINWDYYLFEVVIELMVSRFIKIEAMIIAINYQCIFQKQYFHLICYYWYYSYYLLSEC